MSVTLYLSPQPTRSARARWAFLEAGMPFDEVSIDIFAGQHRTSDYLAVNPLGLVPAAKIDGRIMIESSALALWVAMQTPESSLLPTDAAELRDCLQWVIHAPAELDRLLSTLNLHLLLRPPQERDPKAAAAATETLNRRLQQLEEALAERNYLVGDAFSIADVVVGHSLAWVRMLDLLGGFPVLQGYLERLTSRSAFVQTYGGPIQTFPDPHAAAA